MLLIENCIWNLIPMYYVIWLKLFVIDKTDDPWWLQLMISSLVNVIMHGYCKCGQQTTPCIHHTRCIMYILYDCRVGFRTLQHTHYIVIKSVNIIYSIDRCTEWCSEIKLFLFCFGCTYIMYTYLYTEHIYVFIRLNNKLQ